MSHKSELSLQYKKPGSGPNLNIWTQIQKPFLDLNLNIQTQIPKWAKNLNLAYTLRNQVRARI
jgi:hypothetical protein